MRDRDDFNDVTMSGRLTRKPDEIRKTPDGASVLDFYIACNRYLSEQDEDGKFKQLTTFMKVTAWNKRAEALHRILKQGDEVLLKGQIVDDNFERDGVKTSGRLKLDNLSLVKILRRANQKTEEVDTEE
jgi:single stranded DNA-binding protein